MKASRYLLSTILALLGAGLAWGEVSVRLSYRFAFEDEDLIAGREPSKQEVEAVLCQTTVFLSKSFQDSLDNPALVAQTQDGDFSFDDYKIVGDDGVAVEMPVGLNLTLNVTTTDGSTVPKAQDLQGVMPGFDLNDYLINHVWMASPVRSNFFYAARGVSWKSELISEQVTGAQIPKPDCPKGAQPEALTPGAATSASTYQL
jgi:hypothetical protein